MLKFLSNTLYLPMLLLVGCAGEARAHSLAADSSFVQTLLATGLPLVQIDTEAGEEPSYEEVTAPFDYWGRTIRNATKVPSRVTISDSLRTVYDSGDFVEDAAGATLKVRGNTSAYMDKKHFKLKLQKKADLLDRGDQRFADKDWLLLRTDNIWGIIGFKVSELMQMQWTPAYRLVNLMVNGDYRGLYMLTESVKRNADCRLDVDKQTGYVFELDPYWWNEPVYAESAWYPLSYTFKYPDDGDITTGQLDWFQDYMRRMEASICDGSYRFYLDVPSFARWLLAHDILGDSDWGGSNIYFTKYDSLRSSKVTMGPLWDFDAIMDSTGWNGHHYNCLFGQLFNSPNPSFTKAYIQAWDQMHTAVFGGIRSLLDSLPTTRDGIGYEKSYRLDMQRWHDWRESLDFLSAQARSYFDRREVWIDSALTADYRVSVGVSPVVADTRRESGTREDGWREGGRREDAVYTLSGTRLPGDGTRLPGDGTRLPADGGAWLQGGISAAHPRGIYICGKRKFMR